MFVTISCTQERSNGIHLRAVPSWLCSADGSHEPLFFSGQDLQSNNFHLFDLPEDGFNVKKGRQAGRQAGPQTLPLFHELMTLQWNNVYNITHFNF